MAAAQDLEKPDWANPIDTDMDAIRDNFNFLLCMAVAGSSVAPGWTTTVDTGASSSYAEPEAINLTKGTRVIAVNMTWA